MCWLQLEKEVTNQYLRLKDSGVGHNNIKDSVLICENHFNTVPDDNNKKETMGLMP